MREQRIQKRSQIVKELVVNKTASILLVPILMCGPCFYQTAATTGGRTRLIILADPATDEVIGTSWLTSDGRRTYLHHFAIRPDRQGAGLAHHLLQASLDHARTAGQQIKLEVHRTNKKATTLYTKAGFNYLGDYDVYIIRDLDNLTR